MHALGIPLRERNRLRTWALIHDAAVSLALEADLTHASVEAISARAGVSKRTFFNYFPTKEDAVLGIQEPTLPAEALQKFQYGETDIFDRTVRLLAAVAHSMVQGSTAPRLRELIRRFPELRTRLLQHTATAGRLIEPLLVEPLASDAAQGNSPTRLTHTDSAQALLLLAGAVLRFAYGRDPDSPTGDPAALDAAIETFREIFRKAI